MDFFREQDRARRNTRRLLVLFALAVLALIAASNLLIAFGLWVFDAHLFGTWDAVVHAPDLGGMRTPAGFIERVSLPMFLAVGACVSAGVAIASAIRHLQLARGGAAVAAMLDGRALNPASTHPAERRLLNVVEEMAIASGIPVPVVYCIPGAGINAFAAGYSTEDAVIGVTEAAMAQLGRDELQGVVAHEFSHILNGDMRLNLRLIALLYGILFIAQAGRVLLNSTSRAVSRDRRGGSLVPLGLGLLVLGYAGVFFGRMIKAGVSREREFLADAAAVQFTRNPLGLAAALQRIGAMSGHGAVTSPRAEEASHLFFAELAARRNGSLFATHPPLAERIRRLDPTWDGKFSVSTSSGDSRDGRGQTRAQEVGRHPSAPVAGLHEGATAAVAALPADHDDPLDIADAPPIAGLSGELRAACRDTGSAVAVVLAALIDPQAEVAARQYALLQTRGLSAPPRLEAELAEAPVLPVMELVMPALTRLDGSSRTRLLDAVQTLIAVDGHLDLREISVAVLLQRHLFPAGNLARATRPRYRSLTQLQAPLAVLLDALARARGDDTPARSVAALAVLGLADLRLGATTPPQWSAVCEALAQLRAAYPLLKPRLLKAFAVMIGDLPGADGLLGLLAATLDCPAVILNER